MNELCKKIAANHHMLNLIRIRKHVESSVEDLKENLGISRATADSIYKKLLGETEPEPLIQRVGRRILVLGDKGYFLGVSIGSLYIRVALIDLNFEPVPRSALDAFPAFLNLQSDRELEDLYDKDESNETSYAFKTPEDSEEKFESIRKVASKMVSAFLDLEELNGVPFSLLGIGFAVTGPVDYDAKLWRFAPHITQVRDLVLSDIIGHKLMHRIETRGLFLSLDNNAKASVVSEYQYLLEKNHGRYAEDIVLMYVGSGVGSAAVLDQKLLRGSHNLSGELGHIRINEGTFESYLADEINYQAYIPMALNTINCILGIDRFILVGHSVRKNDGLLPALMDQRLQFTVSSTQQYCKPEKGRGHSSTAAIGAAIEAYFSMCQYDFEAEDGDKMNLAKEISWNTIKG